MDKAEKYTDDFIELCKKIKPDFVLPNRQYLIKSLEQNMSHMSEEQLNNLDDIFNVEAFEEEE